MTPRERAIAALTLQKPDQVPTFELEFQLDEEMFGRQLVPEDLTRQNIGKLSAAEKEKRLCELAEDIVYIYDQLDYAIIPGPYQVGYVDNGFISPEKMFLFQRIRELTGHRRMLGFHADGTFSIPDGNGMYEFAYKTADAPEELHDEAKTLMNNAIERNKALAECGVEVGLMCSDYCYNSGPFLSPAMFEEFIQPYLAKIIEEGKKAGLYMIKHTDGNIMPILHQLVECAPHALHSLDPMAGMDIREIAELVGDRVCLCGNVNCSLLQTGTIEELEKSAEYCLTYGKQSKGYIYCTSNVPFKGIDPKRYQLVLDIWKKMRDYQPI